MNAQKAYSGTGATGAIGFTRAISAKQRQVINCLQSDIEICERPYLHAAQRLGMEEDELIGLISAMLEQGILTRVGPLFQIEKLGGAFALLALKVPAEDFDLVAEQLQELEQVAHNYQREHEWNMWLVLATETPEEIHRVVTQIAHLSGCTVRHFPKLREYFVELKLRVEDDHE